MSIFTDRRTDAEFINAMRIHAAIHPEGKKDWPQIMHIIIVLLSALFCIMPVTMLPSSVLKLLCVAMMLAAFNCGYWLRQLISESTLVPKRTLHLLIKYHDQLNSTQSTAQQPDDSPTSPVTPAQPSSPP